MKKVILLFLVIPSAFLAHTQTGSISGKVFSDGGPLEFANVKIEGMEQGAVVNTEGYYRIDNVPFGELTVVASLIGYEAVRKEVRLNAANPSIRLDLSLTPLHVQLDQVVVTGTRTFKRRTQSPVMVNIVDSETLGKVQACNLSEGLKFQPGLRVETDCQTCNYTQLRMNGLGGGYSQILINGRPVFSPLTGLYGMEQIPVNMIERIEVVRGGGSALYGSSAIGGTVNVITKIPKENGYNLSFTHQNINGGADDNIISGNATVVAKEGRSGISVFVNNRSRAWYDHNKDNFSELPELSNNSFGANLFVLPKDNQKLELSFSSLNEYRYGGEMVDPPAHLAQQSEERTHKVFIGSLDYQANFNNDNSSFIAYLAGQHTGRNHYTGIIPEDSMEVALHLADPPYGTSTNTTFQGGAQFNHRVSNFPGGSNVLTLGVEYLADDVLDVIPAYRYQVDQFTQNLGVFFQSDWEATSSFNLLAGLRADRHNLLEKAIFSPRLSLLYKLGNSTQFRLSWGTGFRAPQAFDTDLHIAFAGGGVSRISLSPDLTEERSTSFSGSVNYDKATEQWIAGFTMEGFFTQLKDAFYQYPLGKDSFGERFEKRNGDGSTVQGATLEIRANYKGKVQLESGFTVQSSLFDVAVENIDGLERKRTFLRTPKEYGYATFSIMPNERFNTTINLVYTGEMELAHFAGAPEQGADEYKTSSPFSEWSFRTGYTFSFKGIGSGLEVFGGIKNITNAYQDDFDSGKNRDSNYIYGPALPRTAFIGLKLSFENQ